MGLLDTRSFASSDRSYYNRLEEAMHKPCKKWHSVQGNAYVRFDTYEEAVADVEKNGGKVMNGNVHDVIIGINN